MYLRIFFYYSVTNVCYLAPTNLSCFFYQYAWQVIFYWPSVGILEPHYPGWCYAHCFIIAGGIIFISG